MILGIAMLVTVVVYWPGLGGPFVFDDFPNIVDNTAIHVSHSDWRSWIDAAFASPSSEFRRPLSSLSFAANWFVGGGNPWQMKATNLAIHLLNGLLLFVVLQFVVLARESDNNGATQPEPRTLTLSVTVAWLLLPINLLAVLYVVQRMESLCQLFVLAGLWAYLYGRKKTLDEAKRQQTIGTIFIVLGLVLGTALGLLCKESAVLLPVYAFFAEVALFNFKKREKGVDKRIIAAFAFTLCLPLIVGLIWLTPHVFDPDMWANRSFTLGERVLTEPRALIYYLRWTLLPDPRVLSLYHDDIPSSTGLLSPITTAFAMLSLSFLAVLAVMQLRKRPLFFLGIAWFFSAHLLTGTIIPLELIFEHRNYFASIGVLLSLFSLLQPKVGDHALPKARLTLLFGLITIFAAVTCLRANDWSNPVRLSLGDANHHPDSVRANYDAARILSVAANYQPSPLIDKAKEYLRIAANIPGSSTLPEQALIVIGERLHEPSDTTTWESLLRKLAGHNLTEADTLALESLTDCYVQEFCHFEPKRLEEAFYVALSHKNVGSQLLAAFANFQRSVMSNTSLAEEYLLKAAVKSPREPTYREDLAALYVVDGNLKRAREQISILKDLNFLGTLDSKINRLESFSR
jgi:hypothetical protein